MRTVERVVVMVAVLAGISGCGGGGTARMAPPAGAMSPEEAVEGFLSAAQEAQRAKAAGEFTAAGRAYDRMAAVFGTDQGSISRSYPEQEVRDRMIVLAACLRPTAFQIVSQPDPEARRKKETLVTAELTRDLETMQLPFRVVLGRGDRWYIEQIQLSVSSFTC